MTVRGKFQVQEKHNYASGTAQTIVLRPVYDQSLPEDARFAKYTPSGEIKMYVDNPIAQEALQLGKFYYVDFTVTE
jgi:hypothetical protein